MALPEVHLVNGGDVCDHSLDRGVPSVFVGRDWGSFLNWMHQGDTGDEMV